MGSLATRFDLHIIDRKGAENPVADNLSRLENVLDDPLPIDDSFYDDCVEAFETLKKALTSAPIVQPPDRNLPFEMMCDATDYGVGLVNTIASM